MVFQFAVSLALILIGVCLFIMARYIRQHP
jgi:hypothetical protein